MSPPCCVFWRGLPVQAGARYDLQAAYRVCSLWLSLSTNPQASEQRWEKARRAGVVTLRSALANKRRRLCCAPGGASPKP